MTPAPSPALNAIFSVVLLAFEDCEGIDAPELVFGIDDEPLICDCAASLEFDDMVGAVVGGGTAVMTVVLTLISVVVSDDTSSVVSTVFTTVVVTAML